MEERRRRSSEGRDQIFLYVSGQGTDQGSFTDVYRVSHSEALKGHHNSLTGGCIGYSVVIGL